MSNIRPEHMAATIDRIIREHERCAGHALQMTWLREEIAEAIAAATADLRAERNDLLVANGQLTTERAGLRAEVDEWEIEAARAGGMEDIYVGAFEEMDGDLGLDPDAEDARDPERTVEAVKKLVAEVARLKRRAGCDTCCGFEHVHIDRFACNEYEPAVAAHGRNDDILHEICDDCQPCPECGGEK